MNKKEILKNLLKDFDAYTLSNNLGLKYDELKEKKFTNYNEEVNYNGDIFTEEGLNLILNHPEFKNHILPIVFSLEGNSLTLKQDYFLTNKSLAYDSLFNLFEEEDSINKIFKICSNLMIDNREVLNKYRYKFVCFLSEIIKKSKSSKNIKEMFNDFKEMKKSDKIDFYPVLKAFLDKNILADTVYESIKSLNNSYLERTLVDYLEENRILFSFKLKNIEMFEIEEKIIFEKIIKFNTNYFMKLGITEDKVLLRLEKFSELICSKEKINYLVKNKEKKCSLILRSNSEKEVASIYRQIKQYPYLIQEFVQSFDDTKEYKERFLTYWNLNDKLSPKQSDVKFKI